MSAQKAEAQAILQHQLAKAECERLKQEIQQLRVQYASPTIDLTCPSLLSFCSSTPLPPLHLFSPTSLPPSSPSVRSPYPPPSSFFPHYFQTSCINGYHFLVCRLEYFKNPSSSASTGGVCLESEEPPSMSDRSGAYVLHKTVTVSQVHLTQSHIHTVTQ